LLSAIRLQQPINPGRKFTHLDAFKAGASRSFFCREVIDFERIMKSRPDPKTHPVSGRVLQRFNSLPLPTGKKDANWQKKSEELHARLAALWAAARKWQDETYSKKGYSRQDTQEHLSLISQDIHPDHLKALQDQKEQTLAAASESSKPKPKPATETTQTY
jgi:hypothetical protein